MKDMVENKSDLLQQPRLKTVCAIANIGGSSCLLQVDELSCPEISKKNLDQSDLAKIHTKILKLLAEQFPGTEIGLQEIKPRKSSLESLRSAGEIRQAIADREALMAKLASGEESFGESDDVEHRGLEMEVDLLKWVLGGGDV